MIRQRRSTPCLGVAVAVIALARGGEALALDPHKAPTQYVHDAWSSDDGLPQNTVTSLAQTADGYLWMGTLEGLVRFDGVRFTVLDKTNTAALGNNHVTRLSAGSSGELWVGTARSGVCVLGPSRELRCRGEREGFDGRVTAMTGASGGGVWVGNERGAVARFDGERFVIAPAQALGAHRIRDLFEDDAGTLWIASQGGGLGRLEGPNLTVQTTRDGLCSDEVQAVHQDGSGRLWVGTRAGLDWLDHDSFVHAATDAGAPDGVVVALGSDRDGALWVGTDRAGLFRGFAGRFETLVMGEARGGDDVRALLEDREGSLWFGTSYAGLHRLRDAPFSPITTSEGLRSAQALNVYVEDEGTVWVSTDGGGVDLVRDRRAAPLAAAAIGDSRVRVVRRDVRGDLWIGTDVGLFRMKGDDPASIRREDVAGSVSELTVDHRGRVWAAAESGVYRHDGSTWTRVPLGDRDDRLVFTILEARDGGMWLGGDGWVIHLDDAGAQWAIGAAQGLPPSQVYDLHEDAGGALWIGTADAGLARYRGGVVQVVGARDGLFDDTVFAVLEDGAGQLWMSCNKGVYRVAIAQLDAFFAGQRSRVESTVFGRRDGMKSPECNGPAGWKAPDGRLWFPTIQGVVSVDPGKPYGNEVPPPVIIEAVRAGDVLSPAPAGGVRVAPGIERIELHYTALSYVAPERMRFRYRLHGFDTDWVDAGTRRSAFYTNLAPGSYRFQVIASNDAGVWNEAGASLAVVLAPAFHQTWYFRALLALAAATVLGLSYFWRVRRLEARQRELAELVAKRTGELREKNQVLTERTGELDAALRSLREAEADLVRAERMASVAALVQGIAHELNNPVGFLAANVAPLRRYCEFLSRVAGELSDGRPRSADELEALTRLSAKKDLPFVARDLSKVLDDMSEGARRIKLIVGDLQRLTSAAPRGVESVDLGRAARQSAALVSPRLPPGARVDLDIAEVPPVTARAGELEQVVVNLLDNATRAVGPDGRIEVQVAAEEGQVRVTVSDDGCGMDDEARGRAFEPFFTTRAAGEGSGLGLAIAAAIVAGHKGSIAIDSEQGKGTRVVFRVPLEAAEP